MNYYNHQGEKATWLEMQCLRSILGVTRLHRIQNTKIKTLTGVKKKPYYRNKKEKRLKWFGQICGSENT